MDLATKHPFGGRIVPRDRPPDILSGISPAFGPLFAQGLGRARRSAGGHGQPQHADVFKVSSETRWEPRQSSFWAPCARADQEGVRHDPVTSSEQPCSAVVGSADLRRRDCRWTNRLSRRASCCDGFQTFEE